MRSDRDRAVARAAAAGSDEEPASAADGGPSQWPGSVDITIDGRNAHLLYAGRQGLFSRLDALHDSLDLLGRPVGSPVGPSSATARRSKEIATEELQRQITPFPIITLKKAPFLSAV